MPTPRQLMREIAMLKKKERKEAFILNKQKKMLLMQKQRQQETLRLQKELRALKSPRAAAFKRNILSAGRGIFKIVLLAGEDIDKRAKELIKNRQMRIEREKQLIKLKVQENILRLKKRKMRKKR